MTAFVILIDAHSFTFLEKGKEPLHKNFTTDEESFVLLKELLSHRQIESLELLFSGDRVVSETLTITRENKNTFAATESTFKNVIENSTKSFMEENKAKDLYLISKEIVALSLNGYLVPKAMGQQVSELKTVLFLTGISKTYRKNLLAALKFVTPSKITARSLAFASGQAIYQDTGKEHFIMCFATAESIELSIKKGREFFETVSIPATGTDISEKIKASLTHLSEGASLPADVFICVPSERISEFENYFSSESYHSLYFTEDGWTLHTLDEYSLFTL